MTSTSVDAGRRLFGRVYVSPFAERASACLSLVSRDQPPPVSLSSKLPILAAIVFVLVPSTSFTHEPQSVVISICTHISLIRLASITTKIVIPV